MLRMLPVPPAVEPKSDSDATAAAASNAAAGTSDISLVRCKSNALLELNAPSPKPQALEGSGVPHKLLEVLAHDGWLDSADA